MILYLIFFLIVFVVWKAKDYFGSDVYKNYSKTSTPIMKTAFNIAFLPPGSVFFLINFRSKVSFVFVSKIHRENIYVPEKVRRKVPSIVRELLFWIVEL